MLHWLRCLFKRPLFIIVKTNGEIMARIDEVNAKIDDLITLATATDATVEAMFKIINEANTGDISEDIKNQLISKLDTLGAEIAKVSTQDDVAPVA